MADFVVEAVGVENTVLLIFSNLHGSGWRLKRFVYAYFRQTDCKRIVRPLRESSPHPAVWPTVTGAGATVLRLVFLNFNKMMTC